MRYTIDYVDGTYEQADLPRRKRLRHGDVRRFLLYWLQGRAPMWMVGQFDSEAGGWLSNMMLRRHAFRLAVQGMLPMRWATVQPDWKAEAEGRLTVPLGVGRAPAAYRGADALPKGLAPHRGGRPPGIGRAPRRRVSTRPEDMLRGATLPAPSDGPITFEFFEEGATPPAGYNLTLGEGNHDSTTDTRGEGRARGAAAGDAGADLGNRQGGEQDQGGSGARRAGETPQGSEDAPERAGPAHGNAAQQDRAGGRPAPYDEGEGSSPLGPAPRRRRKPAGSTPG